jgi:hypothetical protein
MNEETNPAVAASVPAAPPVAMPAPSPIPQRLSVQQPALSRVGEAARKVALTSWEGIWYVLMCIWFGAGYFYKIPAKKALQDFGLTELTSAERFWYVVMCIWFGAGYFWKIPTAKALSELPQYQAERQAALTELA